MGLYVRSAAAMLATPPSGDGDGDGMGPAASRKPLVLIKEVRRGEESVREMGGGLRHRRRWGWGYGDSSSGGAWS